MHANAYDRCIMLETHTPNLNSKPPTLVCARLLGYLLIHALVDKGRDSVADDILNCRCNEDLIELADFFITHLFRCCEYPLKLMHTRSRVIIHDLDISDFQSRPQKTVPQHHPTIRQTRNSKILRKCWDTYLQRVQKTTQRRNAWPVCHILSSGYGS